MPVNYAKGPKNVDTGYMDSGAGVIDPPDPQPEPQPGQARIPPTVTVDLGLTEFDNVSIDSIFCALLAGEVSNRGIGWYSATTPSTLAHRVNLLKTAAKEIRNAFYASVTTY